jgi:hypothetical protein
VITFIKKLYFYASSCVSNQHFSSNNSDNTSSIWGTSGVSNNHLSNPLWSSICNQPTNFFPPNPITDLGVMRPSIETLTSIGHSASGVGETNSDTPNILIGSDLVMEEGALDPLLFNSPNIFNSLVERHVEHYSNSIYAGEFDMLTLPETCVLDRIHNLHILIGTPRNLNDFWDDPHSLINLLKTHTTNPDLDPIITPALQQNTITLSEAITCIPAKQPINTFLRSSLTSAAEQIVSTPTTPVSMYQVDVDIQQLVSDDVIKVIEEVSKFF